MSAPARPTRWRYPLESVPMTWRRTSAIMQRSAASSTRERISARPTPSTAARKRRYSSTRISG